MTRSHFHYDYSFETNLSDTEDVVLETGGYAFEVIKAGADPYGTRIYPLHKINGQQEIIDTTRPSEPAAPRGVIVGNFDALVIKQTAASFGRWIIRVYKTRAIGVPQDPRAGGVRRIQLARTIADITIGASVHSSPINLGAQTGAGVSSLGSNFLNDGVLALEKPSALELMELREDTCYLDGAIYASNECELLIFHSNDWTASQGFNLLARVRAYQPETSPGTVLGGVLPSSVDSNLKERWTIDLSNGYGVTAVGAGTGTGVKTNDAKPIVLPPGPIRLYFAWDDYDSAVNVSMGIGVRGRR